MYEMEGASPGSAAPDRPVARLPRCGHQIGQSPGCPDARSRPASFLASLDLRIHPPGPGTRSGYRFPGLPHVPRVAPGWCPYLAV